MEAEARYTLVGVLVMAVVLALGAVVVWLVGGAGDHDYLRYAVYFRHQSMDGLNVDSPVRLRGVKVGKVQSYSFARDDAVEVLLDIREGTPVREGAQAYVERNIVTGLAAIEVVNPSTPAPLLLHTQGQPYPVIAEGRSDLDRVATALSKLSENGAQVLAKLNDMLSDQNRLNVGQTLSNLNLITTSLARDRRQIASTLASVQQAAVTFNSAAAHVSQVVDQTGASFASVARGASATLQQTNSALANLQRQTSDISLKLQTLSDNGMLEFSGLSRGVLDASSTLSNVSQGFANPRSLIFGPNPQMLGPGEKAP